MSCCEHGDEPSGAVEEVSALEKELLSTKSVRLFFFFCLLVS